MGRRHYERHDDRRSDGRVSLWCPGAPGVQSEIAAVLDEAHQFVASKRLVATRAVDVVRR